MLGRATPRWLWRPIWIAAQTARALGLIRLMTPQAELPDDRARRTRPQIVEALRRQPKTVATLADATTPVSYAQAEAAGGLGDRPLIVLTRGRLPDTLDPTEMDREYAAYLQLWIHEIQAKLARLSTRGRQIIVENSGHHIPDDVPAAVSAAVSDVVAEVRNEGEPSSAMPARKR